MRPPYVIHGDLCLVAGCDAATEAVASAARCCSLGFEKMTVVFEEQPAT